MSKTIKSSLYDLEEAELYADFRDRIISKEEFDRRLKELKENYLRKESK